MRVLAWVAGLAVGGALFAHSTPSLADDPQSNAPSAVLAEPREGPLVWYGWQTLLIDGALTLGVFAPNSGGLQGYLAAGYLLGGPIVHIAHRQYALAAVSVLGRLLLPIAGGAIGAKVATCAPTEEGGDCNSAAIVGTLTGFGVGALTAMVVDAAISWEHSTEPDSPSRRPPSASWLVPVVSPVVGPDRRPGVSLGVAGAF